MSGFVPYVFYLFLYSFDIMPFILNLQKLSSLWISQLDELLNRNSRPKIILRYLNRDMKGKIKWGCVPCFFETSIYTLY